MLQVIPANQLSDLFDQFSVPMFAVERPSAEAAFRLVCINRAHAEATGLNPGGLGNKACHDLLPRGEANVVGRHIRSCAETRREVRFRETLSWPKGPQVWDTVLQHVLLDTGADRVVGTGLQISAPDRLGSTATLEDVRFYSALADMQLHNLVALFDAAKDQEIFRRDNEDRTQRLSGACRSALRSVEDIRNVLDRDQSEQSPKQMTGHGREQHVKSGVVRAICDVAAR